MCRITIEGDWSSLIKRHVYQSKHKYAFVAINLFVGMNNMSEKELLVKEYWESFGISFTPYWEDVKKTVSKIAGKSFAEKMDSLITERSKGKMQNSLFYSQKNSDYLGSVAFGIAYDGSLLTNVSQWLINHSEIIKGRVLDVGCENGLLSCFIAYAFPDTVVLGVDTCKEAIANAKLLAEKMKLTNLHFQEEALNDVEEEFDTVFSLRVLHENIRQIDIDFSRIPFENAKEFCSVMDDYSAQVSRILKNEGNYISIERIPYDDMELGWMLSMSHNCLWPVDISKVSFNEQGLNSSFWATIAEKHEEQLRQGKVLGLFKRVVADPWTV